MWRACDGPLAGALRRTSLIACNIRRLGEIRNIIRSVGLWHARLVAYGRGMRATSRGANATAALTITEAAGLLGVDRTTVYRMIEDGRLTATGPARRRRVADTEVRRYLAALHQAARLIRPAREEAS